MKGLLSRLILRVTGWGWVRRLFTHRFGRRVAMRFVAGETLDDAVAVVHRLNARGFTASLDHLGEHVTERAEAIRARDDYLACIERIDTDGLDANVSVKLSQLGLGFDDDLAAEAVDALAIRAQAAGTTVTIDMEESLLAQATIDLYAKALQQHGNLGLALQAYLRRSPWDLAELAPLGGHIRLCKGAYDEPADIAFRRKADVDAAFDGLAASLVAVEAVKPAIATHDERRIDKVLALVGEREGAFEFQMLYGVRNRLQARLAAQGHPVRVYVPYGDSWYPYLTRRVAERPANLWFFIRAVFGR